MLTLFEPNKKRWVCNGLFTVRIPAGGERPKNKN